MLDKNAKISLPGMEIGEEIGRGGYSILYRAVKDGKSYVVKVLKGEGAVSERDEIALRFHREGTALARFHHPNLVTILEVGKSEGRPYLVMEYVEGATLAATLAKNRPNEGTLVSWARALASALCEVHRLGLVHRDIKPDNILIDAAGAPKLIDFGFVAEMRREEDPEEVVGSFRYSAPEQTGMLKRAVDGRSDLYSLGVVLFECATGVTPFSSESIGELIRQHAAVKAPEVREIAPGISRALSAIIAKLLAKDPDDRYQSAHGLADDLENLSALNAQAANGRAISLDASRQAFRAFTGPELVGRVAELQWLRGHWERAKAAQGLPVLVKGEPGVGKSRLVTEFLKSVDEVEGMVLQGKCSQKNPVPFAPLRSAVDELLSKITKLHPAEREEKERVLRLAAGDGASLLKHLSPGLHAFFHDLPDLVVEGEGQDQFHTAVAEFILRLSQSMRSFVLCIDDLQWIDGATLRVLRQVRRRLVGHPFLLLVICRNDADSAIALKSFVEEMSLPPELTLTIGPLSETSVSSMIRELLGGHEIETTFASQIAFRCRGNPFAVIEYVRALLDEGLLRYFWGKWMLDTDDLGLIHLPGDVVQLVVKRLGSLRETTLRILRTAAVMGMKIQWRRLQDVTEASPRDVATALQDGYRTGLVEQVRPGEFLFVHERVRDALASTLDEVQHRAMHQRIAEVMDREEAPGEEALYALADHYAKGEVERNPERVYATNLAAGQRAAGHYANEEAFEFLVHAYKASFRFSAQPDAALFEALGDLCFRLDHVDTGISFLQRALDLAKDPLSRASIRVRLANGHLSRLNISKAREQVFHGFADLGRPFPRTLPGRVLSALGWWVMGFVARLPLIFGKATGRKREVYRCLLKLYTVGETTAFHEFESGLFLQFAVRVLYPAHALGPSQELAAAYAYYAILLAFAGMTRLAKRYLDRAGEMAASVHDPRAIAECRLLYAYSKEVDGKTHESFPLLRDCLKTHGRWLTHHQYMEAAFAIILGLQVRGYVNEAWSWLEQVMGKVEETFVRDRMGLLLYPAYRGATLARLGRMTQAAECMAEARQMAKSLPDNRFSWVFYLTQLLMYLSEVGESDEEIDEVEELYRTKVRTTPHSPLLHIRYFYLFRAYARLTLALRPEPARRAERVDKLRAALRDLRPSRRLPLFRGHYFLVSAGVASLCGKERKALRLVAAGEAWGREIDQPFMCFQASYLRARVLRQLEKPEAALREAYLAFTTMRENGWNHFARRIRGEFPFDRPSEYSMVSVRSSQTQSGGSADAGSVKLKRQLDALLQVSLASASVFDPVSLARIALDEIIRILGAERGFLFLCKEGSEELVIQGGREQSGKDLLELSGFSSTVVESVAAEKKPIVITGSETGAVAGADSIVAFNLRSIVAVPLMLKERFMGVVYLDNRLAKGVFTTEDVEVLVAIANHIAVAFETSRVAQLEMERGKIKSAFQHYLSHEVIDQMLKDPKQLQLQSERKELTVLFSDVRNFTGISESLLPEQLSELMNAYFTPMTNLILESRGVLDKYIGDAVMAFWGAPIRQDNHAELACEVALRMIGELENLRAQLVQKGFPQIEIGIGINTGVMSVGNMGSTQRFNYTVMGDAVNLGSRLEGLTKVYGVKIILSEYTKEKLKRPDLICRELDEVRVKGKNNPLRIYELMTPQYGPEPKVLPDFVTEFEEGRKDYLARNWARAKDHFSRCLKLHPSDFPSKLYLARLQAFATQPPSKNWDGVAISMRR